jgi:RNA methyltransferase, TrmH family
MINTIKISRNTLKQAQLLKQKKNRDLAKQYLVEGWKIVEEMLNANEEIILIIAVKEWLNRNEILLKSTKAQLFEVTPEELNKISLQQTPQQVLAIARKKETTRLKIDKNSLSLFLDEVQDPGNVGTIIRLADWFGIDQIYCSTGCADVYNPKTLQATMGSFLRVSTQTVDILEFFNHPDVAKLPIFGAFLDGENIYSLNLPKSGILILGNESKGISNSVAGFVKKRIHIPSPNKTKRAESLNVAIAASIICSEFYRQSSLL